MALLLGGLSTIELLVLLLIGMVFFGKRLPEVGRSLGRSIVEFKKGLRDIESGTFDEPHRPPDRIEEAPRQSIDASAPVTAEARSRQ